MHLLLYPLNFSLCQVSHSFFCVVDSYYIIFIYFWIKNTILLSHHSNRIAIKTPMFCCSIYNRLTMKTVSLSVNGWMGIENVLYVYNLK